MNHQSLHFALFSTVVGHMYTHTLQNQFSVGKKIVNCSLTLHQGGRAADPMGCQMKEERYLAKQSAVTNTRVKNKRQRLIYDSKTE